MCHDKIALERNVFITIQVKFDNPAFVKWVNNDVLPQVCQALGVNISATNPRAELYKLLLYGTGSQ